MLEEKITADELVERLKENRQVLCIVNKKKTAGKIFESLKGAENFFYLSTNLCPVHRTQVLQQIKQCLKENQTCRVVSTSLVEAGVDLDFPCVYRETAGLDSIVQAAGRCNREGKFPATESLTYVFKLSYEKMLSRQNLRVSATNLVCEKNFVEIDSPPAIKFYFDYLHKLDGNNLDKKEILEKLCKEWKFKDIAEKFRLIEEDTKSILIPYDEVARNIAQRLLNGEVSRALLRKSGKYIVNVYGETFKEMFAAQKITIIDESLSLLADFSLYDRNTGLKQQIESGVAVIF